MTEAIYLEVTEKAEAARKVKRRVSVSGMLKILDISRSGYSAWLKHAPSNAEKRRESVKAKIKDMILSILVSTFFSRASKLMLFFHDKYNIFFF